MNQTACGFRPPTSSPPSHRHDHPGDNHPDQQSHADQDHPHHLPIVGAESAAEDALDLHARASFRGSDLTCILRARAATAQTDTDSYRREEPPIPAWAVVAGTGLPRRDGTVGVVIENRKGVRRRPRVRVPPSRRHSDFFRSLLRVPPSRIREKSAPPQASDQRRIAPQAPQKTAGRSRR
jgi:hypothetical protein